MPGTPCAVGTRHEHELRQSSSSLRLPSSHSSSTESTTPLPQLGVGVQQIAETVSSLHPKPLGHDGRELP